MFKWITTEKAFVYKLLGLFLLVVLVFGVGSHYVGLGSDPYGIVHFAQHLARGKFFSDYPVYGWFKTDWQPEESYFVLHGNYLVKDGKLFCKYTIGYPLILALSIKLFGPESVYFVNVAILLLLLWFYFKLGEMIFASRPRALFLALFGPLLLILLVDQIWSLALRPSRDLSALMFLIMGLFLGVRSLKNLPRINYAFLFLGAFSLGFSANVRLPNVLAGVPAALYLAAKLSGKVRPVRLVLILILAVFCFSLALLPTLVQNQLTSGSPFKPPRPEIVERDPLKVADEPSPPPLWLGFFKTTAPQTLKFFWRLYGPFFTCLILIGLVTSWKSPETRYLCLGMPLVFILFYSMWVHLMTRYMLIAQPFLILLALAGCGWLLQARRIGWVIFLGPVLIGLDFWVRSRLKSAFGMEGMDIYVLIFALSFWLLAGVGKKIWSISTRCVLLALVLFGLFLARFGPVWFHSRHIFQLPQARQFGRDFDRLVAPGSVVFATKPLSECISLFTRSYSIRPFEMGRVGMDPREGFFRVLNRGVSLYLIDNSGWKRDATKSIPLFREYFDVIPVGRLRGDNYYLTGKFGKPVCTLYQIKPWSEKEVELDFSAPPGEEDYLITLNLRHLRDEGNLRRRLRLEVNGQILPQPLRNGMNYLRLPSSMITSPVSTLRLSSDLPLPREIGFRLQDLNSEYIVAPVEQMQFPDRFTTDHFDEARLRDGDLVRLGWGKVGRLSIPTIKLPETELIGEIRVKNVLSVPRPIRLAIALNEKEIADLDLSRVGDWEEFRVRLPAEYISGPRSELDLKAYPAAGYRPTAAEERWGTLFLDQVRIKRRLKSVRLPTLPGHPYFLAFMIAPEPVENPCPGPYRVLVAARAVKDDISEGIQRLLLEPAVPARPASRLEVVSPAGSCSALLAPGLVLRPSAAELLVDIGSEDDWAFIEDGFYGKELHLNQTPVRWTGGKARLVVPVFPGEGKKIVLSLRIMESRPAAAFEVLPEMAVSFDGKELGSSQLRPRDDIYRWVLPGDSREPHLAILTLEAPTWQPRRHLPTADDRELGVMLDWVKLEYSD